MFVLTDKLFPYIRKSQLDFIPIKRASPATRSAIEALVRKITDLRSIDPHADIAEDNTKLEDYINDLYLK